MVGIGASAGGLEALQNFLAPLHPDSGTAFVIAQHLSPDHPSLIVELLSRGTPLEVREAAEGDQLAPGVVIVGPPNHDMTVVGDHIRLVDPAVRLGPSPNVDLLFESLADQWGDRAVAVVLSGTGSDGANGLRTVRSAGGLTMVQSPESARFDGMPLAAIELGSIDLVADPGVLALQLDVMPPSADLLGHAPAVDGEGVIPTVTAQLKKAIGIDFSEYKESTLRRQIQRRMAIRQLHDVDTYLASLSDDAVEAHALADNLLVTVTSFFRDPIAFEALREELTAYLARPDVDGTLRVWVPGCATGEEVYTIAMLVSDILGHPADLSRRLKVFGTDLDEMSLSIARRAAYPASALVRIPEPLRAACTTETSDGFQIADALRECTVFARHDVGADPPFPRIDLVSCRNTLIYFGTPLQQRVIGMFAFALRPGGLLLLGTAENLDRKDVGFRTVNPDARIFMRTSQVAPAFAHAPGISPERAKRSGPRVVEAVLAPETLDAGLEHQVELLEALVGITGKACLVLDDSHQLVRVVGDVSAYCRVGEGLMTGAAVPFLREELREEARALLLLSRGDSAAVIGQTIALPGEPHPVHLVARRIEVDGGPFTVLVFEPDVIARLPRPTAGRSKAFDQELKRLEHDLLVSQDTLRRSVVELQAVNEELEASTEELQASSEELQAANEELQASNEELQATNEELGTLNHELNVRGDDLQQLNIELENIQSSLSQGMVIVNRNLEVTRYTPLAVRVFALVSTDLGKPLLSAPTTLAIPGFEAALRDVVHGGVRRTIEAGDVNVSYLVQILPYRAPDGRRLGAIVTLTDVSEMVALRTVAAEAFVELQDKSELLTHQATYDAVTGLVNRGHFADVLASEVLRAQRAGQNLALAWIDLDGFKEINDEFGHERGDLTLHLTGQRVLQGVRGSDVVGRLGGDEFGVLIAGYGSSAELDTVLERIIEATREPVPFDGQEVSVSASMGVALFPQDALTPKDLMRAADAAMYAVKRQAGDSYAYFNESMNIAAGARRARRLEITAAMENAEFVMHYQPIIDANTNAVWGVEALVRWERDSQVVTAGEFVPFCEASGQIRALGRVTFDLVRKDVPLLRAEGYSDLRIAYNMSATQLEDRHFAEILEAAPGPDGLRGLVVEILESVFLPDHDEALRVLEALSGLGAETSIDDYGSGYSNVRLLETLSPDYIKLDRSFLSEHHTADSRSALVRSAVQISHVVGAKVIAEGVETDEQGQLVREAGVDFLQGFGIAMPMPMADLLVWLRDRPA